MWEYDLANKIKDQSKTAREKAVSDASGYLGKIEQVNPLKISIMSGDTYFEESKGEILITATIKSKLIADNVGKSVLVIPIDSVDHIALVDLLEEK